MERIEEIEEIDIITLLEKIGAEFIGWFKFCVRIQSVVLVQGMKMAIVMLNSKKGRLYTNSVELPLVMQLTQGAKQSIPILYKNKPHNLDGSSI